MRLIDADALKKSIKSYADDQYAENEYLGEYAIMDIIDNFPTVEEKEEPFITECRKASIEKNLPLYFIYYEESGILEVYETETNELFEKRHCVKHLSSYEFKNIVDLYLDNYSDWKGGAENDE